MPVYIALWQSRWNNTKLETKMRQRLPASLERKFLHERLPPGKER